MKTERTRGWKWVRMRARVLAEEPLCRTCTEQGKVEAAVEVDHILRLEDGGTDERDNLQGLCHTCHARKTALENGYTPRPTIGADGYPVDGGGGATEVKTRYLQNRVGSFHLINPNNPGHKRS